jgi:hypothetical protein
VVRASERSKICQHKPSHVSAIASQPTIARSENAGQPGVSNIATAPTSIDTNIRPVAR